MHRHLSRFKNKRILITAVALLGIVLVTVGVTYAWFSYSKDGAKEHTLTSGSISFHYQEGAQGLTLDDAMPMTDGQGIGQTDYFEFTITSKTLETVDIPYYITAVRSGTGTNMDSVVKVYLTKVDSNGVETPVEVVSGKTVAKVSELGSYVNNQGINTPATEKSLYNDKVWAGTSNYTQKYRLRMWISDDAQLIVQQQGQSDQYPYEGKTYTLKVNVYSTAVDIGKSTAVLRKNVNINSLQLGTDVLVSTNDHYVAEVVIEPNETSVSKILIIDTVNPNTRVSVTEASAINNNRSKTEKLSTSKNLTLGLGSNDYNIVVTSEDGSVSKPYTLTVTGKLPEYQVTLTGSNVTINPSSVTIGYNSTNTATVTVENNYYLDSVTCTNGYTVTAQTGTSATDEQTVTINNNGNVGGSTCTFTTETSIPQIETCPGCKYIYTTDRLIHDYEALNADYYKMTADYPSTIAQYESLYGGPFPKTSNTKLTDYQLEDDYRNVINASGRNYFLGIIPDDTTNEIDRIFACGIKGEEPNQGTAFCIEGTLDTELIDTVWTSGVEFLNDLYGPYSSDPKLGCNNLSSMTACYGDINAIVSKTTAAWIERHRSYASTGSNSDDCCTGPYGAAYCNEH